MICLAKNTEAPPQNSVEHLAMKHSDMWRLYEQNLWTTSLIDYLNAHSKCRFAHPTKYCNPVLMPLWFYNNTL
jgi:hypothetical protein